MANVVNITAADAANLKEFDAVIDVRSPGEFAQDHLPGAINLPVLDDEQRAQVGKIYVQESRFLARRMGAALIARNIARHLETALADKGGDFRPLVYCWRGGQRSGAMATVLAQVGWRTSCLAGGYRTYRRHVVERLYDGELAIRPVLLDGPTGSGKTDILGRLAKHGLQTLDLEGLAEHRGSLFGALPGRAQPSQKMFESRLLAAIETFDPDRPVVLEAESSKVGERMIPPALWTAMARAPRIELRAAPEARAAYLAHRYEDIAHDTAGMAAILNRLPRPPGARRLAEWLALADAGDSEVLAAELIAWHYDPAYRRSSQQQGRLNIGVVEIVDLSELGLEAAADAVAGTLIRLNT